MLALITVEAFGEVMDAPALVDLINSFRELHCMEGEDSLNECLRLCEVMLMKQHEALTRG